MPEITVGDVRPFVQYEADGSQSEFIYPFFIMSAEDLAVSVEPAETPGGHSITGVKNPEGGSVVFDTPPPEGARITLYRDMALARAASFGEGGPFRASALNAELDRLTLMIQQVAFRAGNAVRRAPDDADTDLRLPSKSARAETILGFDGDGGVTMLGDPFATASAAELSAIEAASSRDAAESAADAAAQSASNADGAETKARDWADAPPGEEVEAGRYSARHWAEAAETVSGFPDERARVDLAVQRFAWSRRAPEVGPSPAWGVDFLLGLGLDALQVSRASEATYHDARGKLVTAGPNELRIDHHPETGAILGALVEAERTNLLHDSFAPATQTRALPAGTYTLSVKGGGDCTLSGAATGVAGQGAPHTFVLESPAEVTFTVNGPLDAYQCEDGDCATSFIATPAGGPATRAADDVNVVALDWLNTNAASIVISAHLSHLPLSEAARLLTVEDGEPDRHNLFWNGVNDRMLWFTKAHGSVEGQLTALVGGWAPGETHTLGMAFGGGVRKLFADGGKAAEDTVNDPAPPTLLRLGGFHGDQRWNGHLRRIAVWNRHLSDADLEALTL